MNFDPQAKADTACVRFNMAYPDGDTDAAISAKALVEYFGADMAPDSLVKSYRKNFRAIHAAAQQKGQPTSDGRVLVTAADLEAWAERTVTKSRSSATK
ncbi:hypothetical protein GCM10007242_07180 [Pigmentiphaga litoralis]|uniref:hypothetical protein n=1 Tax=Pigmentiphaga litoralis TaxID=516702 RepID=UPI0016721416|nr:hypothetical protein [Pigmentiphaga litoralis]GGX04600.1 hypothetical protein GCM10007242_07180 [Pigmentiphaga litoralis]